MTSPSKHSLCSLSADSEWDHTCVSLCLNCQIKNGVPFTATRQAGDMLLPALRWTDRQGVSHTSFLLAWSGVHTRVGRELRDSWPPLNRDPNKRSRRERVWLQVSCGREPRWWGELPGPARGLPSQGQGTGDVQGATWSAAPPGLPPSDRGFRSALASLRGPGLRPGAALNVLPHFSPFLFPPSVHRTDLGVKYVTLFPDLLDSRGRWHAGRRGHGRGHPDPGVLALHTPRAGSKSGERAVPSAGPRGGDRARAAPGPRGTVTL